MGIQNLLLKPIYVAPAESTLGNPRQQDQADVDPPSRL
jgi:hypothetical protein